MKSQRILRQNIAAILRARGMTPADLAKACGLSRSWATKVFKERRDPREQRPITMQHLEKFVEVLGLSAYQLFQPGISHLTERRKGRDRRSGQDRRIDARRSGLPSTPIRQLAVTPEDEAILAELHGLTYEQYQHVRAWIEVAKFGPRKK